MRVSDANNGIEKTVSIINVIDSIKAEIVLQADRRTFIYVTGRE